VQDGARSLFSCAALSQEQDSQQNDLISDHDNLTIIKHLFGCKMSTERNVHHSEKSQKAKFNISKEKGRLK
jgi:hypothetical protein